MLKCAQKTTCFAFPQTFYPNFLIFLHRYICHICDILQLWSWWFGDDGEGHGGDGDDNVCDDPDDSNDSFCICNLQIDFLVPS